MKTFIQMFITFIVLNTLSFGKDGLFDIYMTREQVKDDVITFLKSDKGQHIIKEAKSLTTKANIETQQAIKDLKEIQKIVKDTKINDFEYSKNRYGTSAFKSSKDNWYKDTVYEDLYVSNK